MAKTTLLAKERTKLGVELAKSLVETWDLDDPSRLVCQVWFADKKNCHKLSLDGIAKMHNADFEVVKTFITRAQQCAASLHRRRMLSRAYAFRSRNRLTEQKSILEEEISRLSQENNKMREKIGALEVNAHGIQAIVPLARKNASRSKRKRKRRKPKSSLSLAEILWAEAVAEVEEEHRRGKKAEQSLDADVLMQKDVPTGEHGDDDANDVFEPISDASVPEDAAILDASVPEDVAIYPEISYDPLEGLMAVDASKLPKISDVLGNDWAGGLGCDFSTEERFDPTMWSEGVESPNSPTPMMFPNSA